MTLDESQHRTGTSCDCAPCQDAVAEALLERRLARMTWPTDSVKVTVLMARRPDLAALPLIGSRLAAAVAEGV